MKPLSGEEPQHIGPFRLLGRLGSGGMGRVYLARDTDGTTVAVKMVHPHLLENGETEFRRRFAREVDAARAVNAAFTAPVVAADPDAEVPWLATKFVPGIPLAEAVARFGPLPEMSLLDLTVGLFAALDGIHTAGLVHRDVKPSNIMLGVDGPKVIDFGIARLHGASTLTGTGQTVGTFGFMSPEQFARADVGPESDVFSAGAVLAHAATGRPPFPGDTLPVLFANLTTRDPDLHGVPTALWPVIRAALAKDPHARPTPQQARGMVPAPPTRVGPDTGWLPAALTQAVLRAAIAALHTPAPQQGTPRATAPAGGHTASNEPGQARPRNDATEPHGTSNRRFPKGVSVNRGGSVSLSKQAPGLAAVTVELGWDVRTTGADFELDASALLCRAAGQVLSDQHFVFFNNPRSPERSVVHCGHNPTGGDEQIQVTLAKVPAEVAQIVFAVSIYAADKRRQSFGQVQNAYIRVVNQADNTELARYDLTEDASTATAMIFGELHRNGADWELRAASQGYASGLYGITKTFGVNV